MKNPRVLEVVVSRNFVLTFSSFFFLWISFDFFILFPLFILQLGGNSVDVGIQTAIFYLPAVIIRPMIGWVTDRIGRLKVLWFGSGLMVLTAFSFLLIRGNYQQVKYWISLILLLRGFSFASFYVAFFTYTVDLSFPESRARIIGLFGLSGLIAHGAAPKIGELVLHRGSFNAFFAVSGLLSLLSLTISAFLKEQKRVKSESAKGWEVVRSLSLTRRNWLVLPGAFTFGYVIASFNTFGAPYFLHMKQGSAGSFFLIYGGMAAVVRLIFGGLADRYQRWKLVATFFALQGAGLMLILLHPVQVWFVIAAISAGAAHGILFPLLTAMAIDAHSQEFRGVVTSIFTAMIELGFSLGSYILGVLVAYAGYGVMFISAAGFAIVFSVYVLIGQRWPTRPQALQS
jgi:MFS family permease